MNRVFFMFILVVWTNTAFGDDGCEGKHRCNNTLCVDDISLCKEKISCRSVSGSDIVRCGTDGDPTFSIPDEKPPKDEDVAWLKTTVYTVIACTVGVVLFISIVVIAIFRMKMKRSAYRRALRFGRHRHYGGGHRMHGSHAVEHDSFISSPSSSHFGNIIVNVNNGVQYVPCGEFNAVIQTPPSYAEVLAESRQQFCGRSSPPPEYCTVDRNPHRLSSPGNLETVAHCTTTSTNQQLHELSHESTVSSTQSDESESTTRDTDGANTDRESDTPEVARVADSTHVDIAPSTNCSVYGTSSLGRRCCSPRDSNGSRRNRNVRSVASPTRPKQLHVRNGQIVLSDSSSESSSPETVNRNTQTCTVDLTVDSGSSSKTGQIRVQSGEIVLGNQVEGSVVTSGAVSLDVDNACQSPGQLDVKDGQIVFKAS